MRTLDQTGQIKLKTFLLSASNIRLWLPVKIGQLSTVEKNGYFEPTQMLHKIYLSLIDLNISQSKNSLKLAYVKKISQNGPISKILKGVNFVAFKFPINEMKAFIPKRIIETNLAKDFQNKSCHFREWKIEQRQQSCIQMWLSLLLFAAGPEGCNSPTTFNFKFYNKIKRKHIKKVQMCYG